MDTNARGKRTLPVTEGEEDHFETKEKKVRFPKGKKAKAGDDRSSLGDKDAFGSWMNPELAAKERANRRNRNREREVVGTQENGAFEEIIAHSEVNYEDNASLDDDGITLEPFNLNQEREEGYFDEQGNFVEYVRKEIKDAWLDSVDVAPRFLEQNSEKTAKEEDEYQDLSSEDVGKIKRSIANTLKPGETVIQALKRLKGAPSDKKERMPEDTKQLFDQLTEDAMKLMENGEYNVYHEKRETFDREAEGYERVACARGTSGAGGEPPKGEDTFSEGKGHEESHAPIFDMAKGSLEANTSVQISSLDSGAEFDMFGDEDDDNGPNPDSSSNVDPQKSNAGVETDYVYDDSSGYYYSSTLGYYYDPGSGLYCCATTGKWYSYNEQTGAYDEVQDTASAPVAE